MKEKNSAKPHNFLFKDVYSKKKYAMDLFRLTLSKKEFNLFDWETLSIKSRPFFDESWDKKTRRFDLFGGREEIWTQNGNFLFTGA